MNSGEFEIYPYSGRYWYPHMSASEAVLWERFIKQFPDMYERAGYDVKVGTIPDFVLEHEDPAMRGQAPLYRYKIDVVAFKGDQIDIIELKQAATMRAIGQVKGYRELFKREYKPVVEPKCIIITDKLLPDMDLLAASEGVQIVVV